MLTFFVIQISYSQNVGIGTTTPNTKAVLDIQSTSKGILFPRLTTAQRNAITNPPNGLHVFNVDERCLNVYDSVNVVWNCYCDDCKTIVINITQDVCKLDFYEVYAKYRPSNKYIINLSEDVYISGCGPGDTALNFSTMPFNASIIINNNGGIIQGGGGTGGSGMIQPGSGTCQVFFVPPIPAKPGGSAIATKSGIIITVNNYGVVGGGGGGGGVSNNNTNSYGGGGGGGAGISGGGGGAGGGIIVSSCSFGNCVCVPSIQGAPGSAGSAYVGGVGGAGTGGGANGGNGGNRGQAGQNGNAVNGGAGGKAITGGSGNSIINITGGVYYGTVD